MRGFIQAVDRPERMVMVKEMVMATEIMTVNNTNGDVTQSRVVRIAKVAHEVEQVAKFWKRFKKTAPFGQTSKGCPTTNARVSRATFVYSRTKEGHQTNLSQTH